MSTKKKAGKPAAKPAKKPTPAKATKAIKAKKTVKAAGTKKAAPKKSAPALKKTAPSPEKKTAKKTIVTAKKNPEKSKSTEKTKSEAVGATHSSSSKAETKAEKTKPTSGVVTADAAMPAAPAAIPAPAKPKASRTTLDDLALDIDEKDELLEEEKRDLAKALRDEDDEPLETAFVPTDTSERFILVVDEEGQRRNETVTIVQQILPNAVVEVADDPEEAFEVMQDCDFDTYVVNFLMPGFSASPFVKSVANHPDHPLLIGFAADKISDALDQRKGLKIIPLKRLFDLDVNVSAEPTKEKLGAGIED